MVLVHNHLGEINISKQFFAQLIGGTLTNCFGVADTNACTPKQSLREILPFTKKKKFIDKGVCIQAIKGKLYVDLHITVLYGVNISTAVRSIQHKIAYVIKEETDIEVGRVNVFIDGIKS